MDTEFLKVFISLIRLLFGHRRRCELAFDIAFALLLSTLPLHSYLPCSRFHLSTHQATVVFLDFVAIGQEIIGRSPVSVYSKIFLLPVHGTDSAAASTRCP